MDADDTTLAYELRVQLRDIEPPVWRELRVSGDTTLAKLHAVLQVALGWENCHLYMFQAGGAHYSEPNEEWPVIDSATVTLEGIVAKAGPSFTYEYDMGDRWIHEITVSGPVEGAGDESPRCTGGARACPPEDAGGPSRYQEILEAIADPDHEEHDELLEWIGPDFNPEEFDASVVNSVLARMR